MVRGAMRMRLATSFLFLLGVAQGAVTNYNAWTCNDFNVQLAKASASQPVVFTVRTTPLTCRQNVTIGKDFDVTIVAPEGSQPLVDISPAANESLVYNSLFIVEGTLRLENLKFQGNVDQQTRAVQSNGTVTAKNCAFTQFLQRNGAVFYVSLGSLEIDNSTFTMNSAGYKGGSIFVDAGALTVTKSTFKGNSAAYSAGDIYAATATSLTLSDSTFSESASSYDAASVYACGGTISDCKFESNEAPQSGAIVSSGDNCAQLAITGCAFTSNRASAQGGTGGAVRALQTDLSVTSTQFDSNYAAEAGAAIYFLTSLGNKLEVDQCSFSGNENGGLGEGNAVWVENSDPTASQVQQSLGYVQDSTCADANTACDVADTYGNLQVDQALGCGVCVPGNDTQSAVEANNAGSGGGSNKGVVIGLSVALTLALAVAAWGIVWVRRQRRRNARYRTDYDAWADEY